MANDNVHNVGVRVSVEGVPESAAAINQTNKAIQELGKTSSAVTNDAKSFVERQKESAEALREEGRAINESSAQLKALNVSRRAETEAQLAANAARFEASAVAKQSVAETTERIAGHEAEARSLNALGGAAATAMRYLAGGAFAQTVMRQTIEAEQASMRLEVQLRATGNAAGFTKGEIDDLADSLAQTTQFDDESIRKAASEFLLLGNIQGETFTKGIKLATDYAAATGRSVPEAAAVLGKALQSPTEGMAMLERQMGRLTPAQDAVIKGFVAANDMAGAHGAILEVVRQKVGGAAEAMNSGMTKSTTGVTKAWDEFTESVGRSDVVAAASNVTLGATERVLTGLKNAVDAINFDNLKKALTLDFRVTPPNAAEIEAARAAGDAARKSQQGEKWQQDYDKQQSALAKLAEQTAKKTGESAAAERERLVAAGLRSEEQAAIARSAIAEQAYIDQGQRDKKALADRERQLAAGVRGEEEAARARTAIAEQAYIDQGQRDKKLLDARNKLAEEEQKKQQTEARRQAERAEEDDKRRADGITRDISGSIIRGFERGQDASQVFWEALKNEAKTVVLEPMIRPVVAPLGAAANRISGGLGGFISSLLSGSPDASTTYMPNGSSSGSLPMAWTGEYNHEGRGPGEYGSRTGLFPASVFANAPRFHTGVGPGERAAIIKDEESVLTPGQMRALAPAGARMAPTVVFNVTNPPGVPLRAEASGPGQWNGDEFVIGVVLHRLDNDPNFRTAVRGG